MTIGASFVDLSDDMRANDRVRVDEMVGPNADEVWNRTKAAMMMIRSRDEMVPGYND
jgi:hypothetical protein